MQLLFLFPKISRLQNDLQTVQRKTESQQDQMQELSQRIVKLEGHVPKLLDSHKSSKSFNMMEYVNTGDLLWKITDIRRRRKEAASGEIPYIYSQPFYTSANGYKMCAKLYLNGDGMGQGTHISLFLQ